MERELWAKNTLERSATLGHDVYYRARSQRVDWPEPVTKQKKTKSAVRYSTIDDAFSSIENMLSTATHSCQKYYNGCLSLSTEDLRHCSRYHNPRTLQKIRKNSSNTTEDVHMMLPPGSYSVSARSNIDGSQQSHIVHVREGQTVDLNFVL
ncbi:hypothetical protein LOTGIDRAFT_229572 [Lottia gigantea]|uniref:A-kinase-interacting protein 1 n=1 Tax=Lottia gigantea TaxID=225164 RepID=V3Z0N6_LOTGI|nr:hypothetical protein LOTGIDRAFT_229572 [Lottia gigantea]ESO84048.1 hypothetical protein LOTGIDRAFT_229572 [Lottia gigantea]